MPFFRALLVGGRRFPQVSVDGGKTWVGVEHLQQVTRTIKRRRAAYKALHPTLADSYERSLLNGEGESGEATPAFFTHINGKDPPKRVILPKPKT